MKYVFSDLSLIIDPHVSRKSKISLEEWLNWLQRDHLTVTGESLFNENRGYKGYKKVFFALSTNGKITLADIRQKKLSCLSKLYNEMKSSLKLLPIFEVMEVNIHGSIGVV